MADLTAQYASIQEEIDKAVLRCIRSGQYIDGKEVARFAEELSAYTGAHVVACGNGTDALQIALMAFDLQPGDEVIVPDFAYIAAAEAVALLGLTPVVVDVDPQTFNVDATKLEAAISPQTKAIIPVHLFGQTANMAPILELAKKRALFIIEDNAQSIGSIYTFPDGIKKQSGTMGVVGTLSFFPTKNVGCYGDGGALLTNDEKLADKLRMIGRHGQSEKYRCRFVGCNSRLDALQAAILSVKLKRIEQYTAVRQKAAAYYRAGLQSLIGQIDLPYAAPYSTHVYNQFVIRVKNGKRNALQTFLKEKGIPTVVYYPLPTSRQEAFRNRIKIGGDLNVTEELCQTALALPMHTELEEEQQQYIIDQLHDFFTK